MKNNFKYIVASAVMASMGLAACNDLDTKPLSNHVTSDEKSDAISKKPDLASAGVVGISSTYNQYNAVYSNHIDFGWPSVMMVLDNIGPDLVSDNTGYNWFTSSGAYNFGNNNNYANNLAWYHAYKIIRASNDVLKNIDSETEDNESNNEKDNKPIPKCNEKDDNLFNRSVRSITDRNY